MSDIGDLEHSAPGERGDFEKSRAPPGDRGDLALGDLWAGTALGWPGIGFPSPTITSSCDCCQQAWRDPSQNSAILAEELKLTSKSSPSVCSELVPLLVAAFF